MSKHAAEPGLAQAHVELAGRASSRPSTALRARGRRTPSPSRPERVAFLRREAEDLYWNELSWEELTDEEESPAGTSPSWSSPASSPSWTGSSWSACRADVRRPARPHPDVVEEILLFLGERFADLHRRPGGRGRLGARRVGAGDDRPPRRPRALPPLPPGAGRSVEELERVG